MFTLLPIGPLYGDASPLPILKAAQAWFRNVIMLHFRDGLISNQRLRAMKAFPGIALAIVLALVGHINARAADGPVKLLAAENFYGDIARQIGGLKVEVISVMSNPDQDPHLFETSPTVSRQLASAQIVIYNGADYDPWMPKLLATTTKPERIVIVAADLAHKKAGENPHLWYDPPTMPTVAKTLVAALIKTDPAHAAEYQERLSTFLASLKPIDEKIDAIRQKYAGAAVTASEPVFGYMASALGLKMRNERFQLAIMNSTEPSIHDLAAFEQDLKEHKVRLMFFYRQASDKIVQHLVDLAHVSKVPVVAVTETMPSGVTFQQWMLKEIDDTEKALAAPPS
jgi:zinc/manganese transport system substrate-binding protein